MHCTPPYDLTLVFDNTSYKKLFWPVHELSCKALAATCQFNTNIGFLHTKKKKKIIQNTFPDLVRNAMRFRQADLLDNRVPQASS